MYLISYKDLHSLLGKVNNLTPPWDREGGVPPDTGRFEYSEPLTNFRIRFS